MEAAEQQQQATSSTSVPPHQSTSSAKNLKIWFDEFKARVSKKSQASQNSNGIAAGAQEDVELKNLLDKGNLKQDEHKSKPLSSSLKGRKKAPKGYDVASVVADSETSSTCTITNRQGSRYGSFKSPKKNSSSHSRISQVILAVLHFIIPLNYSLPWKLLSYINIALAMIVLVIAALITDPSAVFSFFNGFLCGLLLATLSFIIIALSFIAQVLPKSSDEYSQTSESVNVPSKLANRTLFSDYNNTSLDLDVSNIHKSRSEFESTEHKSDDFSMFEILGEQSDIASDPKEAEVKMLHDDNYQGWMIEYIGDYEMRNSSEIKLRSVFVIIKNRILYLGKPKNNQDADSSIFSIFANQRVYDLNKTSKFEANLLLPKSVRNKQKYVWSKKYPIRLEIQFDESEENTSKTGEASVQLTLFAKSCREKEEWFRRFKRIVETDRLVQGQNPKKVPSVRCKQPDKLADGIFNSLKRLRRRSPSPSGDGVQMSRSSHLLSDSKQSLETCDLSHDPQTPNLTRTKSCELLPNEQNSDSQGETHTIDGDISNIDDIELNGTADDSTLTRETAEVYSQAVEYSNFVDSQPTLNYKEYLEKTIDSGKDATHTCDWFNALTSRIFFDVFSHNYWSVWFKRKIQRKLHRIRLPYFMETLTLTDIDLGTNAPQFLNVRSHNFDSQGLSIDFDTSYSGGLTMTFRTKLDLLKIKTDNSIPSATPNTSSISTTSSGLNAASGSSLSSLNQGVQSPAKDSGSTIDSSSEQIPKLNYEIKQSVSSSTSNKTSEESATSDSEDSDSDSSSDSSLDGGGLDEISDWEDYGGEKTRQNIVKFVDKIASSRYFQHATENRYIKKKLQDISNCPLVLVVQILSLNGVLTLNVPPPQTDRLWYGFQPMPELTLKASPRMGDKEVNLSHVTDWIERRLAEEFRKILVIPNMEDIVLPVLKSDHLHYVTPTR